MQYRKIYIFLLCLSIGAVMISGCKGNASRELESMLNSNEMISVSVALPDSAQKLQGTLLDWKPLAENSDQYDLRKAIDDSFGVISFANSKNGVLYVNPETEEWEPNNTLEAVFKNKAYHEVAEDEDVVEEISKAVAEAYTDLDDKSSTDEIQLAAINAYFNLFPADEDTDEFNGGAYLTRGQYMCGFARAHLQAQNGIKASEDTIKQVGDSQYAPYAELVSNSAYLDIASASLNEENMNGLITRAEVAYMLAKTYYSDEMDAATQKSKTYSDVKDAGNMAEKAETTDKQQYKAANLAYMVENPKDGLDEDLYKAMVVAYNHGFFGNTSESRWDEPITKEEALQAFVNVYTDLGTTIKCQNGKSKSVSAADIDVNNVTEAYTYEINGKEYTAADFENAGTVVLVKEYDQMPPVSYAEWREKVEQMPSSKLEMYLNHVTVSIDVSSEFKDSLDQLSTEELIWFNDLDIAMSHGVTDKDEIMSTWILTEDMVDEGLSMLYYDGKLSDVEKIAYEEVYEINEPQVTYVTSSSTSASTSSSASSNTQQFSNNSSSNTQSAGTPSETPASSNTNETTAPVDNSSSQTDGTLEGCPVEVDRGGFHVKPHEQDPSIVFHN